MQERSPLISQGRRGRRNVVGRTVTGASLLHGGHWGGEGPSSASPRPRAKEDGETTGNEPPLPKPLCPPLPPQILCPGTALQGWVSQRLSLKGPFRLKCTPTRVHIYT